MTDWGSTRQFLDGSNFPILVVTNENNVAGSVTEYPITDGIGPNGNVAPSWVIAGPDTTLKQPNGVAIYEGHIYVADTAAHSITAFPLAKGGNLAPAFSISGGNTALSLPRAIAIDKAGNVFVGGFDQSHSHWVTVYKAGARGNVAPIRRIAGINTGLDTIVGIAVNSAGKIYVANEYPSHPSSWVSGSITIYAPDATGDVAPIAKIEGLQTRMLPNGFALGASGQLYVANNPLVYPDAVCVFDPDAKGDVAPIAVIKSSTSSPINSPVTVALGDQIYLGGGPGLNGTEVFIYPADANGDALPLAKLTGAATLLGATTGIAVGFPWYPTPRERRDILPA